MENHITYMEIWQSCQLTALYPKYSPEITPELDRPMRPDIENKVNDIKRSLDLLRRHL